jgi:peptide/nickel transport system permease protein
MIKTVVRRLLALPFVLFFVSATLFLFVVQIPVEQRAEIYMGSGSPHTTEEQRARMLQQTIERYGLDKPWPVQYLRWLGSALRGDWGFSTTWRQPVLTALLRRVPATVELTLFAMVPATLLAILFGGLAARKRGRLPDHTVRAATFVGWAFPPFILALILMNVLYAWNGWFPPGRFSIWASIVLSSDEYHAYTGLLTVDALLNGNLRLFADAVRHLVLPALTLAVVEWALLTRIMRTSLLDVLGQDYITVARAKGLQERAVLARHARRNALLPLISTGAALTSTLITTVVVIEVIFGFRGIGYSAVESMLRADVPATVGFAMFSCLVVVLSSLIADVLYAVVDPRIRVH